MRKTIPIDLKPKLEIAIDGVPIAQALGLDKDEFFRLLGVRKIDQLCERGVGEDAGRYRASFYFQRKRVRVVVDREGHRVGAIEISERQQGRRQS